jgi:hypothetical protein
MNIVPAFVVAALLAGLTPGARADTLYKCVWPDGKIAYVNQPCVGQAKAARQFSVLANEPDDARDARLKTERATLRAADVKFQQRAAERDRQYAIDTTRDAAQARRRAAETARKEQQRLREEEKKRIASRVGNCDKPRPDMGCL